MEVRYLAHGVAIQEGPSLCAGKLVADLERDFAGSHELSAEDLRSFASARSVEDAKRAETRKPWRPLSERSQ